MIVGTPPVVAVFPWLPGDVNRDASAGWVADGWARHHPMIPTVWSDAILEAKPGSDWCKAEHIACLVAATTEPVLIVSDIDVWVPPSAVRAAVNAVANGALWAVPHLDVHRLTLPATLRVTAMAAPDGPVTILEGEYEQPPYPGHACGGMVVIRRDVIESVPPDRRYVGWGREDDSWALALRTLVGPEWRDTRAPMVHLWHAAPPRRTRTDPLRVLSRNLYRRYVEADRAPDVMRALVEEGRA